MQKNKILWTLLRILGLITVGLFNTVFIKAGDIFSWKNYLGILLLLFAAIDIIALYVKLRHNNKILDKPKDIALKIVALFIPFYFVYYWPLHEKPEKVKIMTLWKYIIAGFLIYIILGGLLYLFEKGVFTT